MIRVCAWCGKGMGETPPLSDKSVTHGICKECSERVRKEASGGISDLLPPPPWEGPPIPKGFLRKPNKTSPLLLQTVGREGLCYELAWRWLLKHKEGTLVHGVVFAGDPLSWINHAWVELDDEVYEPQNDETFSKTAFYQAFQAKPAQRYTLLEATKMALRTRNYGPWSGPEIQDILGRATLLAKGWKGER